MSTATRGTAERPRAVGAPAAPARDAMSYVRHGVVVALFSLFIAIGLAIARNDGWVLQIVYAEAIGLSIWACIDFGRHLFKVDPDTTWPAGWRSVALQAGGVVCGYVIGTWIGDQYCGCSTFELWRHSARTFASYLILCIAVSFSISHFFLSRGKDQRRLRQIANAERDASEAQLKLLESQLEPHMLFNTLANLRALIAVDPPRAQAMLDQLIAYLRATLGASRADFHPLSAEFARLGDYLALMGLRMGPRLQTRFELPPDLAEVPVPPLLLQPLVENAIKHGLEPHVAGGRIEVAAARSGDRLQLQVRDTGAGLRRDGSPGAVARADAVGADPARATPGDDGTRFGLAQVRQRLRTVYGAGATLDLEAAGDAEGGTRAVVTLPLRAPAR